MEGRQVPREPKPLSDLKVHKTSSVPNISVRMPYALLQAIDATAKREEMPRTRLIRTILLHGLKQFYGVEVLLENSRPLPPPKRGIELNT